MKGIRYRPALLTRQAANERAIDWVRYQRAARATSSPPRWKTIGTLQSLTFLAKAGKADLNRVLVLRTASNYYIPPPGVTAPENLARKQLGKYSV